MNFKWLQVTSWKKYEETPLGDYVELRGIIAMIKSHNVECKIRRRRDGKVAVFRKSTIDAYDRIMNGKVRQHPLPKLDVRKFTIDEKIMVFPITPPRPRRM